MTEKLQDGSAGLGILSYFHVGRERPVEQQNFENQRSYRYFL